MVRSSFQNSNIDFDYYKNLLARRFLSNPRMGMVFGNRKSSLPRKVANFVNYCFDIASRLDGVFVASNRKTIVLFYEKKKFKKTWKDHMRYLGIALSIPVLKIPKVLKIEREIAQHRIQLDNYLYVWFLAQEEEYSKLDGLVEINKMLAAKAEDLGVPLVFETSDIRLLRFYDQAGYTRYAKLKRGDETTYFFVDDQTAEKHALENVPIKDR